MCLLAGCLDRCGQGREAAQKGVRAPGGGLLSEGERREACDQGPQPDLGLEPGETCPKAEVDALTEGHVTHVRAPDVQAVRIVEDCLITVRGGDHADDEGALRHRPARHLDVLSREPAHALDGRIEAQQLLDRIGNAIRVVP